jgi:hypothetical protein
VIYSVVPEELAPELYDKLVEYYKDDPHVTVIIDRRRGDRRAAPALPPSTVDAQRRARRDRRRPRVSGEFPPLDAA